ncbi:hypothetical protein BRADI_1g48823v3 [Brachypodium distachyon]|uniref:Uncharacterized protein n=1 Tax=Brachypodium distachyon TaxID=15368 RepID=A0A0Q3H930_BRADI|nr:hypothetical protein BRADI_1g48823v3 [Brachypodium distachyon]
MVLFLLRSLLCASRVCYLHRASSPVNHGRELLWEYARNLRLLGIDAREIESYRALWQCVAPKDKQDHIQF